MDLQLAVILSEYNIIHLRIERFPDHTKNGNRTWSPKQNLRHWIGKETLTLIEGMLVMLRADRAGQGWSLLH